MWDTVPDHHGAILSHDLPCRQCGHAAHTYLSCDDACDCAPAFMPGDPRQLSSV